MVVAGLGGRLLRTARSRERYRLFFRGYLEGKWCSVTMFSSNRVLTNTQWAAVSSSAVSCIPIRT